MTNAGGEGELLLSWWRQTRSLEVCRGAKKAAAVLRGQKLYLLPGNFINLPKMTPPVATNQPPAVIITYPQCAQGAAS
jgi:hypothetical protein